ncbi:hypothetical protein B0H63DRAFT_464269 [Podospora didyma]|uniref:Uncharacterized protein n=1 Tax=Podospora didyma TaxID=330526 RepID=A0AAE0U3Z3_9PEZI|nr:hypothetical protein B0H63DRAFT_464269 [Podospora didyma]
MADHPMNPVNAECTMVPCLYQVAGYVNHNPEAQFSGCRSVFGFPTVATVTLPVDPVLETATATSTYIDIIISTSTAYSTLEETSTSYQSIFETATEYTATIVNTLTTTVPAPVTTIATAPKKKRGSKKRRDACKAKSSTVVSSEAPSSAIPSSAAPSSAPPSSSEAPTSALPSSEAPAPSSTAPLFPLASNCPDLNAYSAACACLEPTPVTEYAAAVTSIVHETEISTVSSTTVEQVTVAVTTIIVKPATTTLTSTLTTLTGTTTIATSTSTPYPVAPTNFGLVLADGPNAGKANVLSGSAPAYSFQWSSTSASPVPLSLSSAGTSPFLTSQPTYKMYIRLSTTAYGITFFTTSTYIAATGYTWVPVTCAVNPSTLIISCTAGSLTRFLQCGTVMYMANPTTTPGGCIEVHMKAT